MSSCISPMNPLGEGKMATPKVLPLEHAKGKTSSFFLHSARLFVPLQAKQWTGLPLASHRRREESPGNTGHSAS